MNDEIRDALDKALAEKLDCRIFKTFAIEARDVKETDDGEYIIESVIASDASIDRYGDIIDVEGWDLKNYKQNPVVQWAHDYTLAPIAKALKTWVEDGKLMQKHLFPKEGINPQADMIRNLIKEGFVNAVSVGFRPTSWETFKDEKTGRMGYHFTKQELLEVSWVPVPANANAIVQMRGLGDENAIKALFDNGLKTVKDIEVKTADDDAKGEENKEVDEEKKQLDNTEVKAGKVLSKSNRNALIAARDAINAVLAADEGEATDDDKKANDDILTASGGSTVDEVREGEVKQLDVAELTNSIQRAVRDSYAKGELALTLMKSLKQHLKNN